MLVYFADLAHDHFKVNQYTPTGIGYLTAYSKSKLGNKVQFRLFKSVNKLTLTIDFSGNNPNSMGITFDRTEFQLLVNDRLVSTFYNEKKIKIPKNGDYFFQETPLQQLA